MAFADSFLKLLLIILSVHEFMRLQEACAWGASSRTRWL
jgi:hypothetical protein